MALLTMAGHLIRRLNQISGQVFQQHMLAAGHDITPVQFATLEALSSHPNIEQAQIATLIAYDRATIGGVIDRLEQKGYIIKKVSRRDRRARDIALSPKGAEVLKAVKPIVTALQQDILDPLSAEEQELFKSLARKVVHAAESKAAE